MNGLESFWAMLMPACHETFHNVSPRHSHKYGPSSRGGTTWGCEDRTDQTGLVGSGMVVKRHMHREMTA